MNRSLHVQTTVLPGHRIELVSAELPVGAPAFVHVEVGSLAGRRPLHEVLANYSGGQLFRSPEEVDAYLNAERNAWDN